MTKRMLIDAGHREETRVAVSDGRELQEFDVESTVRAQLKGNVYLAKVTRVEPSLQAAFIDYGGNRHGFLAFGEIHPDYFQMPMADREALAAEQAALIAASEADEAEDDAEPDDESEDDASAPDDTDDPEGAEEDDGEDAAASQAEAGEDERPASRSRRRRARRDGDDDRSRAEAAMYSAIRKRDYRIQEVIRRNQILLVQVVKEERGTKGAALTTYLSIAGRYCVLMPNTPRGGGISRKIADAKQRSRLKEVAAGLDVPQGMGLIVRTAGQGRTKVEIRRDFNSLLKQWEEIRSQTLQSTAPSLIHEEANIVKRAIRDLYAKDIDEVLVEGDEGYRLAKATMKLLMPSHAARVKQHREPASLFHRYEVERQLDAMHSPVVQLRSGGYIVIDPTEALVAIDVNSGRSTRERSIEETALKTNLEAAQEIARQLRLRDLAGLIVIDFIDMDEHRNERAVERKLKEAMKTDRARTQIGRISGFGLLELSRQRLRPSLQEALSAPCPHCGGSGAVRSTESTALHVLRGIEDEALKGRSASLRVAAPTEVALYLLNRKRQELIGLEERHGLAVAVERDDSLIAPDYRIETAAPAAGEEAGEARSASGDRKAARRRLSEDEGESEGDAGRRRKRRRRGRKDRAAEADSDGATAPAAEEAEAAQPDARTDSESEGESDDADRKRRRRGKRGGRRRRARSEAAEEAAGAEAEEGAAPSEAVEDAAGGSDSDAPVAVTGNEAGNESEAEDRTPAAADAESASDAADGAEPAAATAQDGAGAQDAETAGEPGEPLAAETPAVNGEDEELSAGVTTTVIGIEADDDDPPPASPPRRGWWQRVAGGR